MLNMIAFVLLSIAAAFCAFNGNWVWFIVDVIIAAANAEPAFEWLKYQK